MGIYPSVHIWAMMSTAHIGIPGLDDTPVADCGFLLMQRVAGTELAQVLATAWIEL